MFHIVKSCKSPIASIEQAQPGDSVMLGIFTEDTPQGCLGENKIIQNIVALIVQYLFQNYLQEVCCDQFCHQ